MHITEKLELGNPGGSAAVQPKNAESRAKDRSVVRCPDCFGGDRQRSFRQFSAFFWMKREGQGYDFAAAAAGLARLCGGRLSKVSIAKIQTKPTASMAVKGEPSTSVPSSAAVNGSAKV